jgi:hypothetical protein
MMRLDVEGLANKREHISYSARENNITCKAIWWMVKVQAL